MYRDVQARPGPCSTCHDSTQHTQECSPVGNSPNTSQYLVHWKVWQRLHVLPWKGYRNNRNKCCVFLAPICAFCKALYVQAYISMTIFCHVLEKTSKWFSLRSRLVVAGRFHFKEAFSSPPDENRLHMASPQSIPPHTGASHSWCHSLGPPFISSAWLFASLLSLWPASKLPEGRHRDCLLLRSARHISRTSTITCCYPSDKQMNKWIKFKLPDFNCQ